MPIAPWYVTAGLISFTTAVLLQRTSLFVSPDGWDYWQGAVSIAEGCGYRDFLGHPILAWPPLYSLYLAAWSIGGSTSVGVAAADAVLLGLQGAAWMWFTITLWTHSQPRPSAPALAVLVAFFGLILPLHQQSMLSEHLLYALLPLFLAALWRTGVAGDRVPAVAAVGLAALLIATHHRAAVFIVCGVAILLWPGGQRECARDHRRAALAVLAVSIFTWLAIRQGLGQWDSHVISFSAARETPLDYVRQAVRSTGNLLSSGTIDPPRLAILLHAAGLAFLLTRRIALTPIVTTLILLAACAGAMLAIFNVVELNDDLNPRFLLFIPLLSVPALILGADAYRRAALAVASAAVLIPLAGAVGLAMEAAGDPLRNDPAETVVHPSRVSPAYAFGPPRLVDGYWLVAPPTLNAADEPSPGRCTVPLDELRDR